MKYNPDIHHRRSIRLKDYDYSRAGLYFVTICTKGRRCLFCDIGEDGTIKLTAAGEMLATVWDEIPIHYAGIETDQFVIMPNHIHGILSIVGADFRTCPVFGHSQKGAPAGYSLPDVVHRFKTMTTKKYADGVKSKGWQAFDGKLWQRNYWEHIIRNEQELSHIRHYIKNNPCLWESDKLNVRYSDDRISETQTKFGEAAWMV